MIDTDERLILSITITSVLCRYRHLKNTVSIEVSLMPSTLCSDIITDKHWFMENMLCLLSNAVKYSNKGIIRVTLDHIQKLPENDPPNYCPRDEESKQSSEPSNTDTDSCPDDNPCILICVEDAGIGISEKERMNLFQPFKQVQRLAGGTGLGLYSLSSRIHALQGSRGVCARKDGKQGSAFWFAIPYRPDPNVLNNDDATHPLTSPQLDSPSTQSSCSDMDTTSEDPCVDVTESELVAVTNRRFLVVDDSPSILRVVSRVLTNKNYLVETADNGSAGLDLLIDQFESRHFDVVLMDLQMPVMDGIEAVRRYRDYESAQNESLSLSVSHSLSTITDGSSTSEPYLPPANPSHTTTNGRRLFIIGMSANSDGPTKQCALDAGMDSFLSKPFSMAELQPLIDRLPVA
jgi:CheY-like chemotaxis protein